MNKNTHKLDDKITLKYESVESIYLQPTTEPEILSIIKSLKSDASAGHDQLKCTTVQKLAPVLTPILTKLINLSLKEGQFPDSCKIARVIPIYKGSLKTQTSNYRPISVLPILSKIYESVIYNRLNNFLEKKSFLYAKQYGFRKKSNTLSATNDLINKLRTSIDNRNYVIAILIDLQKAFDTVSHEILLKKIEKTGVTGPALKLIKSYLSNRKQYVNIGDKNSQLESINYGVPQGSILGPLLFQIYINDICQLKLHGEIFLYADDTAIFYFGKNLEIILEQSQTDLDILNSWLIKNILTLNINKTGYMILTSPKRIIPSHKPLQIEKRDLHILESEKYLGLYIDKHLTFKQHIEKLKAKIIPLIGVFGRIAHLLPIEIKRGLYFSLVQSHLNYLIEIWGNTYITYLNDLQIIQNKVIKKLFNYNPDTPTKKLYQDLNLLKIRTLYEYNTCLLIYKIQNGLIHTNTTFIKTSQIHKHYTRQHNKLYTNTVKTESGKRSIGHEGVQIYNLLPDSLKTEKSVNIFKRKLFNLKLKQQN